MTPYGRFKIWSNHQFIKEKKLLITAVGREFPEVKKERIRQQKGEKLSKSKLYQTETKTPIQEYDSQRKASWEKALSLYWSYSQEKSTCHEKGGKRRIVSSTVIYERPPTMKLSLAIVEFSRNDRECSFRFTIALETLCMAQCMYTANAETPIKSAMICSKVGP